MEASKQVARSAEQIEAGSIRCANALFARGVARGDAIGVSLGEGDARTAALRACDALSAVPVCVPPESDADALRAALARASALLHERSAAARVAAARAHLPRLRVVLSVDDGSDADLTDAGSEDFESALAGAAATLVVRAPNP